MVIFHGELLNNQRVPHSFPTPGKKKHHVSYTKLFPDGALIYIPKYGTPGRPGALPALGEQTRRRELEAPKFLTITDNSSTRSREVSTLMIQIHSEHGQDLFVTLNRYQSLLHSHKLSLCIIVTMNHYQ